MLIESFLKDFDKEKICPLIDDGAKILMVTLPPDREITLCSKFEGFHTSRRRRA